jgi:hypothetical protein
LEGGRAACCNGIAIGWKENQKGETKKGFDSKKGKTGQFA